jgi:acetoin utilization protein AcuB
MNATIRHLIKGAPLTVRADDDLALSLQVMLWSDIRHLPVMGGDRLVGVLSERDILRRYAELGPHAGASEKVTAAMNSPPVTIGPDETVADAVKLVTDRRIGCLPVVERGQLIGILTRLDLLVQLENRHEPPVEEHGRAQGRAPGWTQLLVDDVMSRAPLTATGDDTIPVVIDRMGRQGIRHLPVVDGEGRVIGMLSDRDVRTAVGNPLRAISPREAVVRIESTRVAHVMTRAPLTLPAGTRLSRAATLFANHKVGAVPIVGERNRLVGLVSYLDVLRAVLASAPAGASPGA